ncbi:DUF305 domain-containing protein [Streptomyces bathyalis]|uniref:DUF305 domain-containing protein n=1 Tax=Streptomyces bathyalis TaxID=2710756 RepID=A0A7T1T2U1_9ACTN|nr:DUF305 domain-containing protein [Streptomyces bathyalis]QPP05329.1 DUF305 domain-containing protein [Streptomyces bathyalis]
MTAHRSFFRAATAVAATTVAAAVLTACGGNDDSAGGHGGHKSSAPASKGNHNSADVSFATGMIPHHRQAVEMAELADSRASSAEVKSLSKDIEKAQGPEIKKMSGWLKSWDQKVPEEMPGMDHSEHGMPGMMKPEDMDKLKKSSGKKFDDAFLKMMVEHHEGAVMMAATEKSDGKYKPAKDMAQDITTSQTAEIKQMNKLLGK